MIAWGYQHFHPEWRTGSRQWTSVAAHITGEKPAGIPCLLKGPPMMCSCQNSLPMWCSWSGGEINRWLQPKKASGSKLTTCRTKKRQWNIGTDIRSEGTSAYPECGRLYRTELVPQQINYKEEINLKRNAKKKKKGRDLKDTLAKCSIWVFGSRFEPTETNKPFMRLGGIWTLTESWIILMN